jgi:hypothetical protein
MTIARMLALDFGACFTGLLHNQVRRVAFHHRLNGRSLVARDQHEACDVRRDPIVFGRPQLDRLHTRFIDTLTVKRQRLLDAMFLGTFLDPLVDRPKQFFVMCRSSREVHHAHSPTKANESDAPALEPLTCDAIHGLDLVASNHQHLGVAQALGVHQIPGVGRRSRLCPRVRVLEGRIRAKHTSLEE